MDDDSIFTDEAQLDSESFSNERTGSSTEISRISSEYSENIEIPEVQAEPEKMVQEPSTNESSQASQSAICHYRNLRRKKVQRGLLQKVYKLGSKFAPQTSDSDSDGQEERLTSKLTKNLLAFGKKPHLNAIREKLGLSYFRSNDWLMAVEQKDGINMEDYDRMYKHPEFKEALTRFFKRKVIDRELMLSRTTAENKIFYRYYLEVFERNFRKSSFKSISETMMEI